jgi:hypothetical protein
MAAAIEASDFESSGDPTSFPANEARESAFEFFLFCN